MLILDYGDFKAILIVAKDCAAPVTSLIEGEDGTIVVNGPANVIDSFDIYQGQKETAHVDDKVYPHLMYEEFNELNHRIKDHDMDKTKKMLQHSDEVMQIVQEAVNDAGLKLEQVSKMKFNSLMHVNIVADNWDQMIDFYENKLGLKKKIEVKYKEYLNRPDRPEQQKIAQTDPEPVMYAYFEIVLGQFIEMFPNTDLPHHVEWYKRTGLNHFSLTVDDIHEAYDEFKKAGIHIIIEPSKVPSETWQFWAEDLDGNHFEVQQFTDKSYQKIGHID